jgi:hypothetical protein
MSVAEPSPGPHAQAPRTDTINRLVPSPAQARSPYDPDLNAASPAEPYDGPRRQRYQAGPRPDQR